MPIGTQLFRVFVLSDLKYHNQNFPKNHYDCFYFYLNDIIRYLYLILRYVFEFETERQNLAMRLFAWRNQKIK